MLVNLHCEHDDSPLGISLPCAVVGGAKSLVPCDPDTNTATGCAVCTAH